MRSSKIIVTIMMVLLAILFSSGCITDPTPSTDTVIVLNDKNQIVTVTANTDNKKATWSVDGIEKETVSGGTVSYTLNYKDFTTGEHTLKLSDSDESEEWKLSVFNEAENRKEATVNSSRGYDRNTPWNERHRIAREKMEISKEPLR